MATDNKKTATPTKDASPTKATAPKDTPIVKDEEQQKSVVNKPAVKAQDNQTVQEPEAPAKVANQVEHTLDSHTGSGTSFPPGSPMAVVPPSDKQVI